MVTFDGKVVNFTKYTGCFQDTAYQIHYTYTATPHSNFYILTIRLSYTSSNVYKSDQFGLTLHYFGSIPW